MENELYNNFHCRPGGYINIEVHVVCMLCEVAEELYGIHFNY